jgi:hypothetical protein
MMKFLKAIVFTLLLAKTVSAAQPNIIIFLVDDMGVMDTSVPFLTDAVGESKRYPLNDFFRTPNMERLAARGIRFNQFNAMSLCSPSRKECCPPPDDELDQPVLRQRWPEQPAGVELEGSAER